MNDEAVRNLLRQLQSTLDGAATITGKDLEMLAKLSSDIDTLLSQPAAMTGDEHETIVGRLQNAVTHFEVVHPDLTATIAQLSKALADMGI